VGVSIITSANIAYILTVTPTGELWLPDIGSVHISGETILDAEKILLKFIKENKSSAVNVSLLLLNNRSFRIQVVGAVVSPGFINVSSVERLTDAIRKTGGLHKLSDEENITISRKGTNKVSASLKNYQYNGDLNNNPALREGDVIKVPFLSEYEEGVIHSITHKQNYVYVSGFVAKPNGHKYLAGYTVNDYLAMSGGINDFGSKNNIAIYRNGLRVIDDEIIIQPGDQIEVPANMKYRLLGNMSILQTLTAMMTLYLTYQAATN
jgi:protein involved in polysaccharide export with SLBB domain